MPVSAGWEAYAADSAVDHFAWWAETYCVQSVDQHAGKPLTLEGWQREFFGEVLAVDDQGLPVWRSVALCVPRKNGKALALDTPIPTPAGWTTMGDLSVGDEVFDEQGRVCRVTFATDVMHDRPCYRVAFSDGTGVVADGEHLWWAHDRYRGRMVVETTETMRGRVRVGARVTHRERRYSIPVAGALATDPVGDLPVDPYVLGVWLGDGASSCGRVTTADHEIVEEVERSGYRWSEHEARKPGAACVTRTVLGLQTDLRRAGVLGNKHVPTAYLRAGTDQRRALLQGLMDSDGTGSGGSGSSVEFTTTAPRLAADVLELVRSLGFKPVMREKRATLRGKDCGPKWRVLFTAYRDDCVFRLPRKWARLRDRPERAQRSSRRQIVSIDPVQSVPVRCIQVDSPSRVFLCGEGMVPTHNTTLLAAYAVYHLLTEDTQPEILLAAASDKQAGRLFDSVVRFVRRSPHLAEQLVIREYVGQIARADGGGVIHRMASDPNTLHGWNPSLVIVDELHAWTTPSLERAWAALTTGGGARLGAQTITITTAGEAHTRETGILGRLIDGNELVGAVETRGKLTVSRNPAAQTLVWNYDAATKTRDDLDSVADANPASWITREYLARQAANPELSEAEFLQLHGCVWAAGQDAWLPADAWRALQSDERIPDGAAVYVGVDVGLVHDSTAVVAAWLSPVSGRVVLEARVFASDHRAVAHERVDRQRILSRVEEHITGLVSRWDVREVVYDPRFFERSAELLSDAGLTVVEMPQSSSVMADAYQAFYAAAVEGRVTHDGEPVLADHVASTAADKTERGWKVRKLKAHKRIDACVAAVMAHARAQSGSAFVVFD